METEKNLETQKLHSAGTVEENQNNYQSFKRKQIEGTPFTEIWDEEKGYAVALGYHAIMPFETDEAKHQNRTARLYYDDWQFMTAVIGVICDRIIEAKTYEMLKSMNDEKQEKNVGTNNVD